MARLKFSLLRGMLAGLILVVSAGLLLFALYLIHLDREVQRKFANVKWVLPAQVYAAPLEIYPGKVVSAAEFRHELDRLGYRLQPKLSGPGTYTLAGDTVAVDVRPFAFWDGQQPELRVEVKASGSSIDAITEVDSRQPHELVRFDPLLIGSIYPGHGGEDRVLVRLRDVPPLLVQTLLLVEDRDFYKHIGISFRGIGRALWADVRAGHAVQGASTITQQLIKNLFLNDERTLHRKAREALMAVLLERHVSKGQILEAYLNEVDLGQDGSRAVHGFGLASQFYFNKPLAELQPQEIAMLVAIVKGTGKYNARRNPGLVLARRDLVLRMMTDAGYITPEEEKQALRQPLGVVGNGSGAGQYPAFVDLVKRELQTEYSQADLTGEGLRIFTTLDAGVQEALERRVAEDLPELEKSRRMRPGTIEAAGVVTSVEGGEVLAVLGGREARFAGFNRALDARRPIGSLSKPFLYLTALEHPDQFTLTTVLHDEPLSLKLPTGQIWSPHNYDNQLHGDMPLYMALAKSFNLPTIRVGLQIGIDPIRQTYADAGFADVPALPSMFLGAIDMSPLDVAQIYSTLAASGYQTRLLAIHEVLTRDGQPLQRYRFQIRQTLPEGPVYLVTWAMQRVIQFGTARWANSVLPPGQTFAGKTGTTDDFRDSWFAGFGANRVAVIWVGRDDNKPTGFEGATGALRIWGRLMRDLHAQGMASAPPPGIDSMNIDPVSGLVADAGCPETVIVPYLHGSAPTQYAPCANAAKSTPLDWLKSIFK
jgi:penicillin-binding protein 1B